MSQQEAFVYAYMEISLIFCEFFQMILDKKFLGILDQETGVLVVFSKEVRDTTYDDVNETVTAMNKASLICSFPIWL